jgi:hypothetical protein
MSDISPIAAEPQLERNRARRPPSRRPLDWAWGIGLPCLALSSLAIVNAVRWIYSGEFAHAEMIPLIWLSEMFAGLGLLLTIPSYRNNRSTLTRNRQRRRFPNEPWRWRSDWLRGEVTHTNRRMARIMSWCAIAAAVVALVAELPVVTGDVAPQGGVLLYGVLPAVALVLAVLATAATIKHGKLGDSRLTLARVPFVAGGVLDATLLTSLKRPPSAGFEIALECLHVYVVGLANKRAIHVESLYEDARTFPGSAMANGAQAVIHFSIPPNAVESDDNHPRDEIQWRIRVTGRLPGRDYHAHFEVPVFQA